MKWIEDELARIPADLLRSLRICSRGAAPMIERDGRMLVNLTANNYLSLAMHPEVIEAAAEAARDDGAGAGSSRLVAGSSPRLAALEQELAEWKGTAAALATSSGYAAAMAAIPALVDREDGIALEKGAHGCLVAAARLSKAKLAIFRRGEEGALETSLKQLRNKRARRILVVIDGVHSMDGDIAPLPEMMPVIESHDAMLFLDDAHGGGVLGPAGAGSLAHFGIPPADHIIQMGTLSKALGSQGGFIAATSAVVDLMVNRAPAFIYTTGIAPPAVGAAHAALKIIRREPERLARLRANSLALRSAVNLEPIPSPIIPVIVGSPSRALDASRRLEAAGALAIAIRPPTVPRGTARVRVSVQADHEIPASAEWLGVLKKLVTFS